MYSMEGQQRIQKERMGFPWLRTIVALLVSLLIAAALLLAIFSTGRIIAGYWLAIIPIIFSAIGVFIPLGQ